MGNYVRYIILLVLIIAGGLLIISVVNKFSEPKVSKVDNNEQVEQTIRDEEKVEPSLDIDTDDDQLDDTSNSSSDMSTSTSTTDTNSQSVTDNVDVPDTASKASIVFTFLGISMIVIGMSVVRGNLVINN